MFIFLFIYFFERLPSNRRVFLAFLAYLRNVKREHVPGAAAMHATGRLLETFGFWLCNGDICGFILSHKKLFLKGL